MAMAKGGLGVDVRLENDDAGGASVGRAAAVCVPVSWGATARAGGSSRRVLHRCSGRPLLLRGPTACGFPLLGMAEVVVVSLVHLRVRVQIHHVVSRSSASCCVYLRVRHVRVHLSVVIRRSMASCCMHARVRMHGVLVHSASTSKTDGTSPTAIAGTSPASTAGAADTSPDANEGAAHTHHSLAPGEDESAMYATTFSFKHLASSSRVELATPTTNESQGTVPVVTSTCRRFRRRGRP
ncbi:hypothetical protein ZWY2020_012405 [Hordeum vulgare]|nr:hypothetical protein ZWY2020_012405 [Hordeum vulgare]